MEVCAEEGEAIRVGGNKCKKGVGYARQEVLLPSRTLTTVVKTTNPEAPLLPVRSDKLIPRDKLRECMKVTAKYVVTEPLQLGDIVINEILGLGVNIISCRTLKGI